MLARQEDKQNKGRIALCLPLHLGCALHSLSWFFFVAYPCPLPSHPQRRRHKTYPVCPPTDHYTLSGCHDFLPFLLRISQTQSRVGPMAVHFCCCCLKPSVSSSCCSLSLGQGCHAVLIPSKQRKHQHRSPASFRPLLQAVDLLPIKAEQIAIPCSSLSPRITALKTDYLSFLLPKLSLVCAYVRQDPPFRSSSPPLPPCSPHYEKTNPLAPILSPSSHPKTHGGSHILFALDPSPRPPLCLTSTNTTTALKPPCACRRPQDTTGRPHNTPGPAPRHTEGFRSCST